MAVARVVCKGCRPKDLHYKLTNIYKFKDFLIL